MNTESGFLELSQDELIVKILEFVCKNKDKNIITAALIQRDLFTELDENEILHLFDVIKHKKISQILVVEGNHHYLKYRVGLEDYVKNLKKMTRNEKLHRIVEFLSTNYTSSKQSFDSGEIAKAFDPELSIYEINSLCENLVNEEDVINVPTQQVYAKQMMEVLVTTRTHTAYHTRKYLEELNDNHTSIPIKSIISAKNVIVGDIAGNVVQGDDSSTPTKTENDPRWLKILYWIVGILVGISLLYTFISNLKIRN